jgi:AAA+ ATPase superfamily predicted ATPase
METETKKQPQLSLVGTIRRFGKNGVLYEVVRQIDVDSILIRVLDTDEETTYPAADALQDPQE